MSAVMQWEEEGGEDEVQWQSRPVLSTSEAPQI